ncbi:segregation/condensation protein A [Embleya sp. AB8]|uniref:segregation and condensation protein A n=1 Tax=Embleya sp. AB8 TaxID=3156304 RepID=UPI003C78F3E5
MSNTNGSVPTRRPLGHGPARVAAAPGERGSADEPHPAAQQAEAPAGSATAQPAEAPVASASAHPAETPAASATAPPAAQPAKGRVVGPTPPADPEPGAAPDPRPTSAHAAEPASADPIPAAGCAPPADPDPGSAPARVPDSAMAVGSAAATDPDSRPVPAGVPESASPGLASAGVSAALVPDAEADLRPVPARDPESASAGHAPAAVSAALAPEADPRWHPPRVADPAGPVPAAPAPAPEADPHRARVAVPAAPVPAAPAPAPEADPHPPRVADPAAPAPAAPGSVASVALPADGGGGFRVNLHNFEGPFDLLLGLIAKHKLDLTEVALSQVTEEFIGYIRARGADWDLGQATEFLLIAATLLDLKTARLLPVAEVEDEEDLALLEARDVLFARLLQYRAYKQIAGILADRWAQESRRYPRDVALEPRYQGLLPEVVITTSLERFARMAAKAMTPKAPKVVSIEHIHVQRVSVREQAAIVVERLRRMGSASFAELAADAPDTLHVIARFLVLLELFRELAVAFDQVEALGELNVKWTAGADEELVVGAEFDEFDTVVRAHGEEEDA